MKPITNIIWKEEVVRKIALKHNVHQAEVEEVLANNPVIRFLEKGYRIGEDVYVALGQTDAGRYLTVIFIYKGQRQVLITTAYDMPDKHRALYERK
ncbi:MAG: BrnT family toxin [Acidobacteriota bacterium]